MPTVTISVHSTLDHNKTRVSQSICDDMMFEILLQLPAKSLTRFKSASKNWLSLLSSDYFCHQRTLRCPQPQPSLILLADPYNLFYVNPSNAGKMTTMKPRIVPHDILQESNGLLLMKEDSVHNPIYYVYNPTTKRSRQIILPNNKLYPFVVRVNLAFDPRKSPYYKIICLRIDSHCLDKPIPYLIEVYDSKSHTWRVRLERVTPYRRLMLNQYVHRGTHWNNSIYWEGAYVDDCFYYFDIAENEIKALPNPRLVAGNRGNGVIACFCQESNGKFYHVRYQHVVKAGDERVAVEVWELGVGGHLSSSSSSCEWVLKYHDHQICLVSGEEGERMLDWNELPLSIMLGPDACSLIFMYGEKLRAYSFHDKSVKDLLRITTKPCYSQIGFVKAFLFGQSLALV